MNLMMIQDVIVKYAEAISTVLDVDVVIIDRHYNKIAYTTRNVSDAIPINRTSVVGEVMHSGQVLIVQNNLKYPICQNCEDATRCQIKGIISVPIMLEKQSVGAVALLIPIGKKTTIFQNVNPAVNFVQIMADLISSKLKNLDDVEKLKLTNYDRETIVNSMDDGIISFDKQGKVSYYNDRFLTYLGKTPMVGPTYFDDVFKHPQLSSLFYSPFDEVDRSIYYEDRNGSFLGTVTKKSILANGIRFGTLLIFRNINETYRSVEKLLNKDAGITFKHLSDSDKAFQEAIRKAKQYALTHEPVFILSEEGLEHEQLARAIHNYSDRSDKAFRTIDFCKKSIKDLENRVLGIKQYDARDEIIFSDLIVSNGGTVFLTNIEEMPAFIQSRLLHILKTKEYYCETLGRMTLNVRFICHTTIPLDKMVASGYFDEALYSRIVVNQVTLPPIRERKQSLKETIRTTVQELKQIYSKPGIIFTDEAVDYLTEFRWPRNRLSLEKILGRVIATVGKNNITKQDLLPHLDEEETQFERYNMDEIEKGVILELTGKGLEKEVIAEKMGISRATLYRKLNHYQIK